MHSLDRIKIFGTTYIGKEAAELVQRHSIMLMEHIDSPNHVVAKSRNYSAYLLDRGGWGDVENPRLSPLRCSVFQRYLAPHDNLLTLGDKDPGLLKTLTDFMPDDVDVEQYWDKPSQLEYQYVEVNSVDWSIKAVDHDFNTGPDWYTIGKVKVPCLKIRDVFDAARCFTSKEREDSVASSTFNREIAAKELQMYALWRTHKSPAYKMVIKDNHTDEEVFVIDPYYLVQFRYHFNDVHAAFWIGQLEEERADATYKAVLAAEDLEL